MDEIKRKKLLSRIGPDGRTVGIDVPDDMTINGTSFPISKIVFSISSGEGMPDSIDCSEEEFKKILLSYRNSLKLDLENSDLTCDEGEEKVTTIKQIDRSMDMIRDADVEEDDVNDIKRWMDFVEKVNTDL